MNSQNLPIPGNGYVVNQLKSRSSTVTPVGLLKVTPAGSPDRGATLRPQARRTLPQPAKLKHYADCTHSGDTSGHQSAGTELRCLF